MHSRHLTSILLMLVVLLAAACQTATGDSNAPAVKEANKQVLLLSGQNNHDWKETHIFLQEIIGESEHFDLTVTLTPEKGADAAAWDAWQPAFADYDAVVFDYNGEMWPEVHRQAFESYISGGGTAYMVHASNNPFPGWTAYEEMVGILWRGKDTGTRIYMNDEDALVDHPPGADLGAGHGKVHDWQIQVRNTSHPIMKDIPPVWLHAHDELYHGQRGPAANMKILATAYSDPEFGGSGQHELMMWWIPYGDGKVLTFLAGHHWPKQDNINAFMCIGFRTMINRGLEWLTTGDVTSPVPDNFPTADAVSLKAAN
ncbi:MAG: ThuA domain-containing protein [Bacteroidota bacterium]